MVVLTNDPPRRLVVPRCARDLIGEASDAPRRLCGEDDSLIGVRQVLSEVPSNRCFGQSQKTVFVLYSCARARSSWKCRCRIKDRLTTVWSGGIDIDQRVDLGVVASLRNHDTGPRVANQNNRSRLLIDYAFGRRDVVRERGRWILHRDDMI